MHRRRGQSGTLSLARSLSDVLSLARARARSFSRAHKQESLAQEASEQASGGDRARRTVEGDVKGMIRELGKLYSTTFPQNLDSDSACDTGRGSASSGDSAEQALGAADMADLDGMSLPHLDPLCLSDAAEEEARDVLECAEEFLLTAQPVPGQFTGACMSLCALCAPSS